MTEIRVYGNSNGNLNFAYRLDEARWYAPKSSFGLACKTSASKAPTLTTNEAILKGTWHVYMSNFPAVSPSIFILGASRTKLFGVLNLPFKLDFMGMTNCFQHVDITLMWPGPTTNTSAVPSRRPR